jgi:hypothetical protein
MLISIAKPPKFAFFETVEVNNLTEMSELLLANNFSPAIFKNGKRNLENFEVAYCIGLDVDNDGAPMPGTDIPTPKMSIEEAKEAFKEYTHLIMPSRSHRLEKHGKIEDRYRIILFFTEPITDTDTFYATWDWCKAKWPAIDHTCKDPSRGFFNHSAVYSVRGGGLRVAPVTPPPKSEPTERIDLSTVAPGTKGKLGQPTLDFLTKGIEKGGRNAETYKAAKDFQQNLYTFEEASERIIAALRATDTIARDFTEAEALQTIRSAFNREAKHDPRIKPNAFALMSVRELKKTEVKKEWLVDKLLAVGGTGLISSEPKAGKSVLVRQLIASVAKGEKFLERDCKQGAVIYLALEEPIEDIKEHFEQLGVNEDAPISIHAGEPLTEAALADFAELISQNRPALAVIDTMFDLISADENNYKEVKREMRNIRKIARESGTHVLLIHHNNKGDSNPKYRRRGQRSILGSTAIAGGVDTIMVMEVDGHKRYMTVTGRGVQRLNNCLLRFDYKNCTYSLGPAAKEEWE